ncbi:F0F1 ATP synthase subunit B [Parabacteroides sp. Marseille-P3160]|uniref:F0F1 ATP synthase subunit B n=1 Tax=Parabacteroides sp. Marseille-P3160 TaxID=1917887 RepID=UPI0009BA74D6|nr:F0F1 ATP synthase subunit B [Parabacteroides sp. Marseille-P3160]
MGLLQPESGLLFWMLLSFVVVFIVLAKFGFPVITKMVNDRKQFIDKSLQAADEANAQLAGIKANSEALLAQAREDQVKILKEASETRERIIKEAKEEAQAVAKKQLDEVRLQIEAEKNAAIQEARREIASLSIGIAERIIRKNLEKGPEQMELIDRLLDEISASKS